MNTDVAERQLAQWAGEYAHIYDPEFTLPEPFVRFAGNQLAKLIESLKPPETADEWNVVRANVNGSLTRVKIGKLDKQKGRIFYDYAEPGHIGMGIMNVSDVHPDDHRKLAVILDRIEGGG